MQDKLRAAFSLKERAEMFLANLEKLKEEKSVGEAQYRVLKIEYAHMREDAISRINTVKTYVKKELDSQASKVDVFKQELSYLEARFKVGQLSANDYLLKEKGPKRRLTELERRISELQTFLNASSSTDLGVAPAEGGLKVLGFNLGFSKRQPSGQVPPIFTGAPATNPKSPHISVESVSQPPQPPPVPPPAPVMVGTAGLQIMPARVMEGGTVGIIVAVTNVTQGNVEQNVELKINGEVRDSRNVALFPGQSQELTFVQVAERQGNYKVDINGVTGNFNVVPAETIRSLQ